MLPNHYILNNSTSSQIQLVYFRVPPRIDYNYLDLLNDFSLPLQNVFTTVSIDGSYFQRTTENLSIFENLDNDFDITVPLKIKKHFTRTVNIQSVNKYIPKIIIE